MSGSGLPYCPNCEKSVLIPLSAGGERAGTIFSKMFARWICLNCGFCVGTGDSAGYNIPKDIKVGIFPEIVEKVKKASSKPM